VEWREEKMPLLLPKQFCDTLYIGPHLVDFRLLSQPSNTLYLGWVQ
jgi:hypothetical protein